MKNLRTTLLTLSGVLLLLLSTSAYSVNTIKSIDGCLLNLFNDKAKETNIVNLKSIAVLRYSKAVPNDITATLIYGAGFVQIGRLSNRKLDQLNDAYEFCN